MSEPVEPPITDELPEMIQRAAECNDPHVFRLLDVIIAQRIRRAKGRDYPPKDAA